MTRHKILIDNTAMSSSPSQTNNSNSSTSTSPQSLTGIPYPNIPHENSDAVEHNKKFSRPTVVKVTDGVYSAIGYDQIKDILMRSISVETISSESNSENFLSILKERNQH